MSDDCKEPASPGWQAIDEALFPIYRGVEPMHWGTILPWQFGGRDPIYGISAYRNNRSRDHLHYITYGFTELWEKESADPNTSGFGFELTFRLASDPNVEPPGWALSLLQNLGRYVFNSGRVFGAGHSMSLNGPIALEYDTKIRAIAFVRDPELPPQVTPNGQMEFLQIVGLTEDELSAIESWNATRFLQLIQEQDQMLITDLVRDSYLSDPLFARKVHEVTALEGASAEALFCEHARFELPEGGACRLVFGANVAKDLARRLVGRIPYGRPFSVYTAEAEIRFEPEGCLAWAKSDEGVCVLMTAKQCGIFASDLLNPRAGTYRSEQLPGLTVVIEKTILKDAEGNVVNEIG